MVCNAIYSVSRTCRIVYQHPQSPFNLARLGDKPLPLVRFLPDSPVYFDRHTLSIKDGQASMFTLDGRMRFQLGLTHAQQQCFREARLREIVLAAKGGAYRLDFFFAAPAQPPGAGPRKALPARAGEESSADIDADAELPEYILITDPLPTAPDLALPPQALASPGHSTTFSPA
jgi:hypothetical protein